MILEIAQLTIKSGHEAEFEANATKAVKIFARAKGCHGMEIRRLVDVPTRYCLLVKWETLENHIVDFRGSKDFQEWRNLVAHCFDGELIITNWQPCVSGFTDK